MRAPRLLSLTAAALLLALGAGSATAQAPIKVGDINTYSGIGAPFTGPYRRRRRDGRRGDQRQGRRARPQGRGPVPRRQGPARRGGQARPGAGRVRQGRDDHRDLPLQRGARGLGLGQAEQDHVPGLRVADRGAHLVQGARLRGAPAPEYLRAGAHAGRQGRQDEVREVGHHRPQLRVRQAGVGDLPGPAQGAEARRADGGRALADAREDRAGPARHRDPEPEPGRALRLALRQRLARLRARGRQARALPEDVRGRHPARRARVHRPAEARGARGHAGHRLSLVRREDRRAPGVGGALHQARGQDAGARLAHRLHHLPVGGRGHQEGGRAPRRPS